MVLEKKEIEDRKAALLKRCRFYKGEENCPDDIFFWGWECESIWVHCLLDNDTKTLDDAVSFFRKLIDQSDQLFKDGTPIAVQSLLFERFCHQSDDDPMYHVESFRRYYAKYWHKNDLI